MAGDVAIISQRSWQNDWTLQDVHIQLLMTVTLSEVKQTRKWLECLGPEGQRGILNLYVANIAMTSWGNDLLQQWNSQIDIHSKLETKH